MNPDKFTQKTQEAFNAAQSVATRHGHSELKASHLLSALLDQEGGITPPLIEKAGANVAGLKTALEDHQGRQPKFPATPS